MCVCLYFLYAKKIPYLYSSHNYFILYIYLHIKNCHVWIIYICEIVWYIFIRVNNRDEIRSIFLVQVHWYSQVLRLRTKTERRLRLDFILFYLLLYVYVCLYIFFHYTYNLLYNLALRDARSFTNLSFRFFFLQVTVGEVQSAMRSYSGGVP